MNAKTPVESLRKGLEILQILSCQPASKGTSLAKVAEAMGLKRNTTHNLLKTLCMCGFASNSGDGRYTTGPMLFQLVRNSLLSDEPDSDLLQSLANISAELGEALVLTTLIGGKRRVLARTSGDQAIRVDTAVMESGAKLLWSTVTGRIMAAFCSAEELDLILATDELPGDVWSGIDSRADLTARLQELRDAALAEIAEHDVASMAVPVLTKKKELVGALGVYLPKYRCDAATRRKLISAITRGSNRLSAHFQDNLIING